MTLHLTGDPAADALLSEDPLALLIGMLLDQQIPMEKAFLGPKVLAERLGGLDAAAIAALDATEFGAVMAGPPAVHRFPGSMGARVQALCSVLVEDYGGEAAAVWRDADTGAELLRRLKELPGFGEQKAKIFLALLGKRLDVRPTGWREAAAPYGDKAVYMSVADVVDPASIAKVREHKQRVKQAAREEKG